MLTRWYMRMGTANDLMFSKPFCAQGTQQTQGYHALFRVKNVVYYAFEVKPERRIHLLNFSLH